MAVVPGHGTNSPRTYPAIAAARVQPTVAFRVAGKIVSRAVDEGQKVHRGDVLMTLDRTDLSHDMTNQGMNAASLRAAWENAAADERRYRGLEQTGAVSRSFYDGIRSRAESLYAQLRAAEANHRIASDRNDYTVLKADEDGTVLTVLAETGAVVSAGQPVLTLAQAGPLEASVDLPESVSPDVGSSAIVADAGSGRTIAPAASLRQIGASEDPATRTVNARYVIPNGADTPRIGQTLTVTLPSPMEDHVVVPLSAILDRGEGPGVWIIDCTHNTVFFHAVHIRSIENNRALIVPDRTMNDLSAAHDLHIVSSGVHDLHAGEAVTLSPDKAQMQ
ncbi:efflux RND transporter periplasmic adaptor subunit [Acetobacter senegalensis]|uniref:efflux RND transporter periplasmic adaptor subunit n=1 Tax=Acetobacter senegalensis TaxID=446692 RepID=UPI00344718D0